MYNSILSSEGGFLTAQEARFIISLLLKRKRQILSAQAEVEDLDKAVKTLRRWE